MPSVLLTGATGFVGSHVLKSLLTTTSLEVVFSTHTQSQIDWILYKYKTPRLKGIIVEEITAEGAFDEAVRGIKYTFHIASPFHYRFDQASEILDPAIKGTLSIIKSAKYHANNSLEKFVITSSMAAIMNFAKGAPPSAAADIYDERTYNQATYEEAMEPGASKLAIYCASKVLA
ncbi:uncharacterized protein V1510DRAFT_415552 [Dipodascopsis tothii]|uniref:uncharacterized protein n=1 Tax=Dipodascopsis tothii TaxID=44089 RepID=UPI0034CE5F83